VRAPSEPRPTAGELAGRPAGPYAVLAARARRASDGALAGAAAVGVLAAAAVAAWRPAWWALALPPVAVGAFGLWGILEREAAERRAGRAGRAGRADALGLALRAVQWLAVVVGTAAAGLAALAVLGALLGRVIS